MALAVVLLVLVDEYAFALGALVLSLFAVGVWSIRRAVQQLDRPSRKG